MSSSCAGSAATITLSKPIALQDSSALFRTADALPSDRVAASISDPIDAAYALGYAIAVLNFNAPVQGCARPATVGAKPFTGMMGDAYRAAKPLGLPELYTSHLNCGCSMPCVSSARWSSSVCKQLVCFKKGVVPQSSAPSSSQRAIGDGCQAQARARARAQVRQREQGDGWAKDWHLGSLRELWC